MAAIGNASNDTADLLQKLSLDSQAKSLEVHETPKKFGSLGARNAINSLAKPYERSAVPIQDFTNLNMYYPPNGYSAYYYGGYDDLNNLWSDYRYLHHDGVDMHSGLQQRRPTSGMSQGAGSVGRSHLHDQMYGNFGNSYRGGCGFGVNYYNPKSAWQNWRTVDNKYTPKGRNNGFFSYGSETNLSELSKGPRSKDTKNELGFGSVKLAVKGQDLSLKANNKEENLTVSPDKEQQYNKEDFPESYSDAKFFIIKSYSEDDVHKSIKYNVWASTPNGNKKLDSAYHEAQGKSEICPIFLLFSVNASGQFVGLAQMVGPVDFDKSMDFWQQDKWTGCFPVKWHIVKDVPNSLLKHITLENNENKPVTNSRDTQEVKLEQAIQVLKIFKSHVTKTSILDDFEFYEARQRALQEKKAKRQQFQKQMKNENGVRDDKLFKSSDLNGAFIESKTTSESAVDIAKSIKADNNGTNEKTSIAC